MQERISLYAGVRGCATCNVHGAFLPELIRKGRFDELFFVDLPNQSERKQIFALQLNRHKHDAASF